LEDKFEVEKPAESMILPASPADKSIDPELDDPVGPVLNVISPECVDDSSVRILTALLHPSKVDPPDIDTEPPIPPSPDSELPPVMEAPPDEELLKLSPPLSINEPPELNGPTAAPPDNLIEPPGEIPLPIPASTFIEPPDPADPAPD